jgi:hypothetical protein
VETSVGKTKAATDFGGEPVTWSVLLEAYRVGPKEKWSAVLLARLGPWLTVARKQLRAVPPYLDQDDVAQQLIVEVLQIASRWRPVCEDRWIPRRLVERAARKVLKSLLAERLDQTVELDTNLEAAELAEPALVIGTPLGKASADDLRVIYRASVLGVRIEDLAAEADVTPKQMQRRLKSTRARVRAAAASGAKNR